MLTWSPKLKSKKLAEFILPTNIPLNLMVSLFFPSRLICTDLQEHSSVGDKVNFEITPNGFAADVVGSKRLQTYAQLVETGGMIFAFPTHHDSSEDS